MNLIVVVYVKISSMVFGRDRRAEEVKVLMPVDTQSSLPTTMYLPAIKKVFFFGLSVTCMLFHGKIGARGEYSGVRKWDH